MFKNHNSGLSDLIEIVCLSGFVCA